MITQKDVKSYVRGNLNYLLSFMPYWFTGEQKCIIMDRANKCEKCIYLKNKKCSKCGCKFPALLYDFDKHCPIGRW